jgi:hypothetical protein
MRGQLNQQHVRDARGPNQRNERWVGGVTAVPVGLAIDVHRIMKAGQAS